VAKQAKTKHKALTIKRIERLRKQPGRYRDGAGEVRGLYLEVVTKTNCSWLLRYMRDGRERWMGLGPLETVSLKEAREKAKAARKQLVDGVDPIAARQADKAAREAEKSAREAEKVALAVEAAKAMTFGQAATEYIAAHQASWKNSKHRDQWRMTLLGLTPKDEAAKHDYCKVIRDLPVNLIDAALVLKVLRPIWNEKTETASRLRGRIETVLDYARVVLKLREGDNPARWEGNLEFSLPKKSTVSPVENFPALPYTQMFEFMTDLRRREGMGARALEFSILTAARTSDTIGGKWSEIDKVAKLWTVPKERMKGQRGQRKRDHVVPLSPQALALLDDLPREGDYLFPGSNAGAPLSNAAMAAVVDRMNEDRVKAGLPKWTDPQQDNREVVPHGFRSTFMDWGSECTAFPGPAIDMALSHVVSDKVEAAYRRGTLFAKRVKLMAAWGEFCESPPATTGADVIPLRGGEIFS